VADSLYDQLRRRKRFAGLSISSVVAVASVTYWGYGALFAVAAVFIVFLILFGISSRSSNWRCPQCETALTAGERGWLEGQFNSGLSDASINCRECGERIC
jgi:hypothetical protein